MPNLSFWWLSVTNYYVDISQGSSKKICVILFFSKTNQKHESYKSFRKLKVLVKTLGCKRKLDNKERFLPPVHGVKDPINNI